jgi:hypothetical protein
MRPSERVFFSVNSFGFNLNVVHTVTVHIETQTRERILDIILGGLPILINTHSCSLHSVV